MIKPKQMRLRIVLPIIAGCAIAAWLISSLVSGLHTADRYANAQDANAQEMVAKMVIEYLDANQLEWPDNWTELYGPYLKVNRSYSLSFQELQDRVQIDWKVDSKELLQRVNSESDDHSALQLIWLTDEGRSHWKGSEPNEMVIEYLKRMP